MQAEAQVKLSGKVKWFDPGKGFGFITRDDGEKDVFLHYSAIVGDDKYKSIADGQEVDFELRKDPRGVAACNVKAVGTILRARPRPKVLQPFDR